MMKKLAGILLVLALVGTSWIVVRASRKQESVRRTNEAHAASDEARPSRPEPAPKTEPEQREPAERPEPAKPKPYRVTGATGNPDRADLRVRVFDAYDRAIAGFSVSLTLSIDGVGRSGPSGKTDAAGQIAFRDLHADEVIAASVRVRDLTRSALLRLTDGQLTELTFRVPGGFGVEGTIRDVKTGPIPQVMVVLSRSTDNGFSDRAYGQTDRDGAYRIDGVPAGRYKLEISGGSMTTTVIATRDGFDPQPPERRRRIQYHERDQGELEVVSPGPVVKNIVLGRLSIEGTVRDAATGIPIPGVVVNLQSPHWARTATDAQGRFRVASMAPGKYSILLKKDGYALKFVKGVEILENDAARVDFAIERAAKLHIHLKDPNGRPVSGQHWIRFDKADKEGWSSNLVADADGYVVSKVVPLGPMKISVAGNGWKGGPVAIVIQEGENTVEIPLERIGGSGQRSLSGIVRDKSTGAPIQGVRLRVQTYMSREVYTDKQGRFVFEDLRPGSHRLYASRDGYGDTTVQRVKIAAGEEATLEIELHPAATIHLRVTDSAGSPVPGRILFVYAGGTPRIGRGLHLDLDEDGRVSFARLPPGPYSITVHLEGRGKGSLKREIEAGENSLAVKLVPE